MRDASAVRVPLPCAAAASCWCCCCCRRACVCRHWHCGRVCGVTFSTLCKHMMDKGVVTVETRGFTVMVT